MMPVYYLQGEPFRPVFLGPKRKLRTQLGIERETGRAVVEDPPRGDIFQRILVRRPRKEEMSTEQDWPSVWPAARSFRSSVVPLPVRMGARRDPKKMAPFKTEGNLELVKIPNFLHLTPAAIERHCNAIKKFCTAWPENLDDEARHKFFPLTLSYNDYVHQSNSLRDMRSRIIVMKVRVSDLHLDEHAFDKLVRLAGDRYNPGSDMLTIVTDRCFTRKQNFDYAMYLLVALYSESYKIEEWEAKKYENLRLVSRITSFKSSKMEDNLEHLLSSLEKGEKETFETVREYAESIKKLLGIPEITDPKLSDTSAHRIQY
ncbi:unnamed protein product [Gongylonema pulchrum]|uniref:MRP-S28 domain-containing protein n=1 Tax=Gongylonema pulchrum TaxID=637853 RepID=A0A183DW26_9BILA|nr:unnamed protein product [Gongylonema pulchrum]